MGVRPGLWPALIWLQPNSQLVRRPWPRAWHGRLSPGVTKSSDLIYSGAGVPTFGALPGSTEASCFMPNAPEFRIGHQIHLACTFPLG